MAQMLSDLHRSASVPLHMDNIRAEARVSAGAVEGGYSLRELLGARNLRRQLVVGVVIQLSMQLSGIDIIFYVRHAPPLSAEHCCPPVL